MEQVAGVLKRYAWGSLEALPALLGREPDGEPWAELWFGTHSGGPATVVRDGRVVALESLTGELPYLAKFLAAGSPLSLQVHPSTAQAVAGFEREQATGVPLDAPQRIYRDPAAKPEVLIAVSPFDALCGFRPIDETVAELRTTGAGPLADLLADAGPAAAVTWLLDTRPPLRPTHPLFDRLDSIYPGDPGALVALLLNRIELRPGEGVFLPAGQLHMYLEGLGVEVMGASDNVVRGGLTPKHVDIPELGRVLDGAPRLPPVLRPGADGWYELPTSAFAVQQLRGPASWTAVGPELVLCVEPGVDELPGTASFVADGDTARSTAALAYRVTAGR